jgi:chemotaxis protein MotB
VLGQESAKAGGAVSVFQKQSPSAPSDTTHSPNPADKRGGTTDAQGTAPDSQVTSDDHLERSVPSKEKRDFASAAEAIRQAMQENPDIAQLSKQVMVDETPEGLRIQLVDQDGRSMFTPGTAEALPQAKKVLAAVARIIDRLPNRISISGHTDGKPFTATDGSGNWELSAARANAARAILTAAGLSSDRVYEVAGKAGSQPLLPEDPYASANRRLSIVLMREAPPVPPGHQL